MDLSWVLYSKAEERAFDRKETLCYLVASRAFVQFSTLLSSIYFTASSQSDSRMLKWRRLIDCLAETLMVNNSSLKHHWQEPV